MGGLWRGARGRLCGGVTTQRDGGAHRQQDHPTRNAGRAPMDPPMEVLTRRQTQHAGPWSCSETLGELKLPLDVDRYRRAGVSLVVRLSSELKPRALGGGETADFEENIEV